MPDADCLALGLLAVEYSCLHLGIKLVLNAWGGWQVLNELVTVAPMCCTADTVALLENPLKQAIGVGPMPMAIAGHAHVPAEKTMDLHQSIGCWKRGSVSS